MLPEAKEYKKGSGQTKEFKRIAIEVKNAVARFAAARNGRQKGTRADCLLRQANVGSKLAILRILFLLIFGGRRANNRWRFADTVITD